MDEVFEIKSFSQDDYDQYCSDWNDDLESEKVSSDESTSKEYKCALNPQKLDALTDVYAKDLSYDDKVRFIKFCFSCDGISNVSIISNLVIIAQGRLIDEELYEDKNIFFNDDIEYLDICTDLREEVLEFDKKLVTYFLGCLKSMSNLIPDGAQHIPNLYYNALSSYSLQPVSSAMQKVSIDYDALPYVYNGDVIVKRVFSKRAFVDEFVSQLISQIEDE